MRHLRAWLLRAAVAVGLRRSEDDEFGAELDAHLDLHIADNLRAGMPPDQARRAALLKLGGITQTIERQRDRRGLPFIDTLRQDLLYTARTLRANPGFAVTAISTLALGLGATTAIFSAVNAVLLRPLPFTDPERLVMIYGSNVRGDSHDVLSYPTFVDWRQQSHSFEEMAAFANASITVSVGGQTEYLRGKRISASMFRVLGVAPALGRAFTEADQTAPVVILSDGFWKRHFGGSPAAIGQTLRITDSPFTIVGVMPAGFHIDPPEREQLYVPLAIDPNRKHGFLRLIARLRPELSRAAARADLDAIAARLEAQYGRANEAKGSTVEPLVDALAGPGRLALLVLLAVVSAVLLIACTNVASLLLARGAARQREMAVRAALGAGRSRLTRQLLTESLVIALAGGAAGLLVAAALARVLVKLVGDFVEVPRLDSTSTDSLVLLFTLVVSVVTGVLFGVVPALSSASPDLSDAMREGCTTATGVRGPRVRRTLVIVETALAVVLLSGAGVLMRALITMRSTQPGFDTRNMVAAEIWLPPARFGRVPDRVQLFDGILTRVRALPAVRGAAFIANLPLNGSGDSQGFLIVGQDLPPGKFFSSGFNIATPGYFQMMGIPILEGRGFADADRGDAPGVLVINRAAARRFWPDQPAIGRQIRLPIAGRQPVLLTVVGVAADVRHSDLVQPPQPEIYLSAMQSELSWSSTVLAVRTIGAPGQLIEPIRAVVRDVNAAVPIYRINTMEDVVARSLAEPRLYSWLFTAFSAAAVALAAIGLYGLVSFSVTQRSKELSVRVALGASRFEIISMVLRQGLGLASLGAAIGLAGGVAVTRSLGSVVRGLEPGDPITFVAVTGVLLTAAAIACYLPARRAARLDPLAALRSQ